MAFLHNGPKTHFTVFYTFYIVCLYGYHIIDIQREEQAHVGEAVIDNTNNDCPDDSKYPVSSGLQADEAMCEKKSGC